MPALGLDLGSYAIKAIVGNPKKNGLDVLHAVEMANPIGAILPDTPQRRDVLVKALKEFFEQNKLNRNNVHVGLAESLVSTKVVRMPLLSDAELASAIQWQVEQHIPIPLDQMQYEYTVLQRSDSKATEPEMQVLIIGVKKQVVESLADIFFDAEINVVSMETDTLAQLRLVEGLVKPEENIALLHLGAASSTLAFVAGGTFQFVHVVPVAGALFTRAIERGVGLDAQRAEEYKRTYGLTANQLEGRVRAALSPIVDSLVAEIQKALRFFGGQQATPVSRIFVTGGSLYLPDLLPYISQAVNVEFVPLEMNRLPGFTWKEPLAQDSRFAVACGLAMKKGS